MAVSFIKSKVPDQVTKMTEGMGTFRPPDRVYVVSLQQIQKREPITEDLFVGWRYVTEVASGKASAVFVSQDREGRLSSGGRSTGSQIAKSVQEFEKLKTLPNIQGKYEVTLFRIPGLYTDCYWLKPVSGGPEWIVPFDTPDGVRHALMEKKLFSTPDFLQTIAPLAEKRLASKKGPEFPSKLKQAGFETQTLD